MHTETAPHACLQLSLLHICLQKARCRARARVRNDWLGPLGAAAVEGLGTFHTTASGRYAALDGRGGLVDIGNNTCSCTPVGNIGVKTWSPKTTM